MLYTGKGDDGSTKTFGCNQRISKGSSVAEALGSLDEINSFLGLVKIKSNEFSFIFKDNVLVVSSVLEQIQQDLFIIQAGIAGADKRINPEKIKWLEDITNSIEKIIPPINSFFVSGGSEISALLDIARTISRRAERRVVSVNDEFNNVSPETLAYLNRLSSILYAFVRFVNLQKGIDENKPNYN